MLQSKLIVLAVSNSNVMIIACDSLYILMNFMTFFSARKCVTAVHYSIILYLSCKIKTSLKKFYAIY